MLYRMKIVTAAPLVSGVMMSHVAGAKAQTPYQMPPTTLTCTGDQIVWVNTRSHVYHFRGERYFGSTKYGGFTCDHAADAEGDRAT